MAERLVLCGQAEARCAQNEETLRLSLDGPRPNIALRIEDVSRRMVANVPNLLTDLIEIATYVFCADQAVSRGGDVMKAMGTAWRRQFRLVVPVREPERWSSPEVSGSLTHALTFLSDDEFRFEFTKLSRPRAFQSYLDLECDASAAFRPDEVLLFSGGLDSLGGAIDELAGGRSVALVSHQSSPKMAKRQRQLAAELANRFPCRVIGWRQIDGKNYYLHSGGPIGSLGMRKDVETDLGELSGFRIPEPPVGDDLRVAIAASLRFVDAAPARVTIPLYACIW